jgi:hypothetical protein
MISRDRTDLRIEDSSGVRGLAIAQTHLRPPFSCENGPTSATQALTASGLLISFGGSGACLTGLPWCPRGLSRLEAQDAGLLL